VAVDLHSGAIVWEQRLPAPPSEILPLDDRLFVGSANNYFYCLSLLDGGERWTWRTGGDVVGTPVVDEARVYFMSRDSQLRAHDRGSGNQRWSQSVPGRIVGGPIRSEGFIVLASLTPRLHAYQRADGRPAGGSPEPTGDTLQSALIAPPSRVRANRRDAFLLLTRQGALDLFVYAEPDEDEDEDEDETVP
jgi:outer membrane protein assembly factor BamB